MSGLIGNPLDNLFVSLFNTSCFILELLIALFDSLHHLIKHFIRTSPLSLKPFLLQKLYLNIIDRDLPDRLFEVSVILAIEARILLLLLVQLLPYAD